VRLGWPSRQLLSARKYTVSYRIISYKKEQTNKQTNNPLKITQHQTEVHSSYKGIFMKRCSN